MASDADIVAGLVDALPVGVWVARAPGGEFVYANAMFAEIMGMSARSDVAVGEYAGPYGICTPEGVPYPEDRMPFVIALRERKTITVDDIVIHRHDGRRVGIRATARPVMDAAGTVTHVVIAFIDITREHEAEKARLESEQRLQLAQRMESIGNLAGGVAHDFNNLLSAIRILATTLRISETDPKRREDLARIDEVTDSAGELTRALLGFARRGKHRAERISLNDVVESIAALIQRTFDRAIEVVVELRASPGLVIGDAVQLEQVVMNLAVNARDAICAVQPEGTGPTVGRLTMRTRDEGAHVVLEVTDTGVGIDPAIRHRIFEPYFTTKTSGAIRGTGLGLATVYGIVEAHGGHIAVESVAPRGTTMRVTLSGAAEGTRRRMVTPPTLRRGSGTVLLVEDEPQVRQAATRALEELGYQVLPANDGAEAVELYTARAAEIAAVILDMIMPRMGGRQTYLALRRVREDVPVLLTTGYALNEEAQAILELGVRGFLPKPYSAAALSEALANVITPENTT